MLGSAELKSRGWLSTPERLFSAHLSLFEPNFLLSSEPPGLNRPKHRSILLACPLFPYKSTAVSLAQKTPSAI